jgi:cytochrome oxidase Cu insertion factor (SCO1/SenC/PrrC family)
MIKLKRTLTGFCLGLLLLPLAGLAQESEEERARKYFTDTVVVDQNGNKLRFYSDVLKDRVVLISFMFMNCEGACPMLAQKLKQTRALMVPAIKDEVWFVTLSVAVRREPGPGRKPLALPHRRETERRITDQKTGSVHAEYRVAYHPYAGR